MGKHREVKIPFDEISDNQTISDVQERKFKEHGLDIHKDEVDEIHDDHYRKVRTLKVKNVRYFG